MPSLLYKGDLIAAYVVDRAAVGMQYDAVRLQMARDMDGLELTPELYERILKENRELYLKRHEELAAAIEKQNPIAIIMDSIERLQSASRRSEDVKDIASSLATLRGYVELLLKRMGAEKEGGERNLFIQQNYYLGLEDLQRQGFIKIEKPAELREYAGVGEISQGDAGT